MAQEIILLGLDYGGSQLGQCLRDIFSCHAVGGGGQDSSAIGIQYIVARDAAKHPIVHRTASHYTELSNPKCE